MDIGCRIKQIRKHFNLTQSEFAARLKSVQNTITGYETGRRNPSSQVIELICREFNISEAWLRNGDGEMFIPLTRNEEIFSWATTVSNSENDGEFVQQFAHVLTKLTIDDWKALEHIANLMIAEKKTEQK